MDFSGKKQGGTTDVAGNETLHRLTPTTSRHSVELKDVQLDLRLTKETLSQMSEVDQRTTRVFSTSARFAFR